MTTRSSILYRITKQDYGQIFRFMPLRAISGTGARVFLNRKFLNIISEKFGDIEELTNPKHSTSNNFQVKGHVGSFGIVSTITNPFCDECNRIRVTADGKMKNCLFANSETDLLTPMRNGEEMNELIINSIKTKKFSRDGMDVKMDAEHYEQNRSMISIGG